MARGNARQRIVGDDHDRERLLDDLRRTVLRCGWELLAFVFMENHLHLLLKTPRPNLALGMQQFLSSYAIWHGRRHSQGDGVRLCSWFLRAVFQTKNKV